MARAAVWGWACKGARWGVSGVNVQGDVETAAVVRAAGGDAIDVGQPTACEALVKHAVAHCGRLDVACNSTGITGPPPPKAGYPWTTGRR